MGPTGLTVATNLRRLREARGLSLRALAESLRERGRSLSADALNKIELAAAKPDAKQIRRVDVDDLVALAAVLGVSPSALLLPPDDSPRTPVEITGNPAIPADSAWAWVNGRRPLGGAPDQEDTEALTYQLHSLPPRQRRQRQHPLGRALEAAENDIQRVVQASDSIVEGQQERFFALVESARASLGRLTAELDHVERDYRAQAAELLQWKAETAGRGTDGASVD